MSNLTAIVEGSFFTSLNAGSEMPIKIAKHCRLHPEPEDGTRILVMRYWPRGVTRESFDTWMRELAPSEALLSWIRSQQDGSMDPDVVLATWKNAYAKEMAAHSDLIDDLRRRHEAGETITLLCACHDPERCHRSVLRDLVLGGSHAS